MNQAQRIQRSNLIYFFVSLIIAILVFAVSAFLIKNILSGEVGEADKASTTCVAMMRAQGLNPTYKEGVIEAIRPARANIESIVSEVGVAVALCPAFELQSFCAGEGCNPDGVKFTLKARPD